MVINFSGLASREKKAEILQNVCSAIKKQGIKGNFELNLVYSLYGLDNGIISYLGPGRFEIWLNKALSPKALKNVISHEICHLRQFLTGDLEIKSNRIYWKGRDQTSVPYLKREFEREARAAEVK